MQKINEVKLFCDELAKLWSKYPDYRFGQMMYNFTRAVELKCNRDLFYIENNEIMELLKEELK